MTEYWLYNLFYTVSGKEDGTCYYRIRAQAGSLQSDWSNVHNVSVDSPPDPPLNPAATSLPDGGR